MKSNYIWDYSEELNAYCIEDNGGPFMSVTNNAENVLTEINKMRASKNPPVYMADVLYRDTEGCIDQIIPNFKGDTCDSVEFLFRGYKNFSEHKFR